MQEAGNERLELRWGELSLSLTRIQQDDGEEDGQASWQLATVATVECSRRSLQGMKLRYP